MDLPQMLDIIFLEQNYRYSEIKLACFGAEWALPFFKDII